MELVDSGQVVPTTKHANLEPEPVVQHKSPFGSPSNEAKPTGPPKVRSWASEQRSGSLEGP